MPVFNVVLKEMRDAQVSHISLVDRGANRIPFKVLKQEKDAMPKHFAGLDLGQLFARKSEKDEAEVVGLVALVGDDEAKQRIAAAGFDVDKAAEQSDGTVVFAQVDGEVNPSDTTVIKWDEGIAMVVKGFSPYSMDLSTDGGASFSDQVKAQGFYPGIRTVMEVLTNSVSQAVSAGSSPSDAADMVGKMFDEAREYTMSFVRDLPEKAFKLDKEMTPAEEEMPEDGKKKKKKKPIDGAACKEEGEETVKSDMAEGGEKESFTVCKECKTPGACKKAGACATAVATNKSEEPGGETPDEDGDEDDDEDSDTADSDAAEAEEAVQKGGKKVLPKKAPPKKEDMEDEEEMEDGEAEDAKKPSKKKPVVKQDLTSQEVLAMVTAKLDAALGKFTDAISGMADRVEKAENLVAEAAGKVDSILVPGSEAGDPIPATKGEKGLGAFGTRDIDTAFMPSIRKQAHRG